jgi:hypothetical protein
MTRPRRAWQRDLGDRNPEALRHVPVHAVSMVQYRRAPRRAGRWCGASHGSPRGLARHGRAGRDRAEGADRDHVPDGRSPEGRQRRGERLGGEGPFRPGDRDSRQLLAALLQRQLRSLPGHHRRAGGQRGRDHHGGRAERACRSLPQLPRGRRHRRRATRPDHDRDGGVGGLDRQRRPSDRIGCPRDAVGLAVPEGLPGMRPPLVPGRFPHRHRGLSTGSGADRVGLPPLQGRGVAR